MDVESTTEVVRRPALEILPEREGGALLGRSDAMGRVRAEVDVVARSDLPVLITGETGTGKELVAHLVHARSMRSASPMVYVNCAALPETIAESELFGHVRGAFTGAVTKRSGKFELADGGTLFLDEIGELPAPTQAALLRAIQFGEVQRIGTDQQLRVDVRVIAATNRDLRAEVHRGRFRSDLYHRLSGFPIHVPPLRDRPDDVALLAGHFLERARLRLGCGPLRLLPDAERAMSGYTWPGNVRELDHVVTCAALRASAGRHGADPVWITRDALRFDPSDGGTDRPASLGAALADTAARSAVGRLTLAEAADAFKAEMIRAALAREGGNLAAAARTLGVDRGNLHRTAHRLGVLRS